MLSIISGAMVFGAGGAGLWYFMPRGGATHPLATVPVLDSIIPICIVALLGIGTALVVSGAVSF